MTISSFEERVLTKVIDQYIQSRRNKDWPMSVATAVTAIRAVSRYPELSDQELGSMVAAAAIAQGLNVAFDMKTEHPQISPAAFQVNPC